MGKRRRSCMAVKILFGGINMKRKFISFTDNELTVLANALEQCSDPNLLKQVNDEMREREYNRKIHEEWLSTRQTIYCC